MNYQPTVVPIIEANYDRFTPMERIIADFFIANQMISSSSGEPRGGSAQAGRSR